MRSARTSSERSHRARSLTEKPPQLGNALLFDRGSDFLAAVPAGQDQPQAEILILGECVAPWPLGFVGDDVVERGEAVELPVSAHPGRSQP